MVFEYKITWRVDSEEYFTVETCNEFANNIKELSDTIESIEKDHTIISIDNLTLK